MTATLNAETKQHALGGELPSLAHPYGADEEPAEISRKYLVQFGGLQGAYSFTERVLMYVPDVNTSPEAAATALISNWWDGMENRDDTFYTADGEVALALEAVHPISGALYSALSRLGLHCFSAGE